MLRSLLNPVLRAARKNVRALPTNELEKNQASAELQNAYHFAESSWLEFGRNVLNHGDVGDTIEHGTGKRKTKSFPRQKRRSGSLLVRNVQHARRRVQASGAMAERRIAANPTAGAAT